MLRVNAINRQELLKRLTFHPKSLVFKTVSVPVAFFELFSLFYFVVSFLIRIFAARNKEIPFMSQLVLNIEDASLIPSLKKILGAIKGVTISKPQKKSYRVDPYEISPSGDTFFADSRNVKAVEDDIAKAHQPGAKFTRLESKEDITAFINSL